ncbi:MAG: 16S rRNA (guanine(527)-N(7))-methyltransferase RsmG, partial [Planctomycetota bacterium]
MTTEATPASLQPEFDAALLRAGIADLTPEMKAQLQKYCRLLWDRNEVMNLTRHTTAEQFVFRDLLDSWQLARLLGQGEHVLDIGSGGGVPGLLLAILRPDLKLTLSDSVKKKARALEEFAAALDLQVEIYDCRAESLLESFGYDSPRGRA